MAHAGQNVKDKGKFARNGGNKGNHANRRPGGVNKQKRKWVPDYRKPFDGSVGEGQGFAFMRKEKVQHQYNKLKTKLRKERTRAPQMKTLYSNDYPEHLRHLYAAEAEKLREDIWENRKKRVEGRMGALAELQVTGDLSENDAPGEQPMSADMGKEPGVSTVTESGVSTVTESGVSTVTEPGVSTDQTDPAAAEQPETTLASVPDSLPMSNRQKKKMMKKKSSFQKSTEEFETIQEKRLKKKEEFLKDKEQREEAIQKYKQKKKEKHKILSTKTKKGQPNLNVQMDYLLKKIQESKQ